MKITYIASSFPKTVKDVRQLIESLDFEYFTDEALVDLDAGELIITETRER